MHTSVTTTLYRLYFTYPFVLLPLTDSNKTWWLQPECVRYTICHQLPEMTRNTNKEHQDGLLECWTVQEGIKKKNKKTNKKITSCRCSRAKESCACLIHSHRPLFLSNRMINRAAWQEKPLPPKTDRQRGGETGIPPACLSDVTSDRLGLAADDRLQKAGRQEVEERKEEGQRIKPPSRSSSGRLLDWRQQKGGRVVVTAYCLSSVCCGSSLSAHSSRPGYLYPLNIHAGGGRLQSFS